MTVPSATTSKMVAVIAVVITKSLLHSSGIHKLYFEIIGNRGNRHPENAEIQTRTT